MVADHPSIVSALLASSVAQADVLPDCVKQCDAATAATVPDFECDAGTEVLVIHPTFVWAARLPAFRHGRGRT
jgi:hypothetical protein